MKIGCWWCISNTGGPHPHGVDTGSPHLPFTSISATLRNEYILTARSSFVRKATPDTTTVRIKYLNSDRLFIFFRMEQKSSISNRTGWCEIIPLHTGWRRLFPSSIPSSRAALLPAMIRKWILTCLRDDNETNKEGWDRIGGGWRYAWFRGFEWSFSPTTGDRTGCWLLRHLVECNRRG